ncbi:MAG: outer membrane beta-barrel protein, partial [Saprospiraceae bacterium]
PRPYVYLHSNNIFKVGELFNFEVLFWYYSDQYEGVFHREQMFNLSLTLDKSFFNNQLKCRFIANDIFHGVVAAGNYNVGQTDIYFNRRWTTEYFRLAMSYTFGKLKEVGYKNRAIGGAEKGRTR